MTAKLLYKMLVLPLLTYVLRHGLLVVFERKILRKIYGPVNEGRTLRRRNNEKLYVTYTKMLKLFIKSNFDD